MPKEIVYFAYGSNMSSPRFAKRLGRVGCRGAATLTGHTLKFHKFSKKDKTGKCDAYCTGHAKDEVIGVVYVLTPDQKPILDGIEGLGYGYNEKRITVSLGGEEIEAVTYVADNSAIRPDLLPTRAYRQHVLDGAAEHRLPQHYLDKFIASVPTID